jgi:hypothetical protein
MTNNELIFKFIETWHTQWVRLPVNIRQLMADSPSLFRLEYAPSSNKAPPVIIFKETVAIKWNYSVWEVDRLFPDGTLNSKEINNKPL